jgi:NADH:ubiquinone oxidoreductase subunit 6 (subunit J)
MLESTVYGVLAVGMIIGALQAIRAHRLITSALCLAAVSVQMSVMLYLLGAPELAVIELSVGAGLVTVLFVFAISVAGELTQDLPTIIPRPLAWSLALFLVVLLGWFLLPIAAPAAPLPEATFAEILWQQRALDVWLQIALIFAGVLGMLGLLTEETIPVKKPAARPKASRQIIPEIPQPQPVITEVGDVVAH